MSNFCVKVFTPNGKCISKIKCKKGQKILVTIEENYRDGKVDESKKYQCIRVRITYDAYDRENETIKLYMFHGDDLFVQESYEFK